MPMDLPARRAKSVLLLTAKNWAFLAGVAVGLAIGIFL